MSQESAEILERAAELLETRGWCRDTYSNEAGQHCAMGALSTVAADTMHRIEYADALAVLAAALLRSGHVRGDLGEWPLSVVVQWNDYPFRTADEVIETLKLVAKDLRNEAAPE